MPERLSPLNSIAQRLQLKCGKQRKRKKFLNIEEKEKNPQSLVVNSNRRKLLNILKASDFIWGLNFRSKGNGHSCLYISTKTSTAKGLIL